MSKHSEARGGPWKGARPRTAKKEELIRSDVEGIETGKSEKQVHPPHLRGRDIGMWYARRNYERRGTREKKPEDTRRQLITIGKSVQKQLQELLIDVNRRGDTRITGGNVKPGVFEKLYSTHMKESLKQTDGPSGQISCAHRGERDDELDRTMLKDFQLKSKKIPYRNLLRDREKLPVFKYRDAILNSVNLNQVTVISGETGCGKTTQVPQFILDSFIANGKASQCRIICTQPRRISAISVAERVSDERVEGCGQLSVGYQIRLERRLPNDRGSILFCTTGVVLKFMESDELLSSTTHLIMDEIHERDLHSDIMMILTKGLLLRRPDFKLILMSATLNAERFSEFFNNCPIIRVPGFTYPVKQFFLEDVLEMTKYTINEVPKRERVWIDQKLKDCPEYQEKRLDQEMNITYARSLQGKFSRKTIETLQKFDESKVDIELIATVVKYICLNECDGAILVFLPGWVDIDKLNKTLKRDSFFSSNRHLVLPLHSMMPTVNQKEVFLRPPAGVRKIILATQIAETSITIDDVVFVIDSGKVKLGKYDANTNIGTLLPEWVSTANSRQRRGRAGRVQPGICYHLYTKLRESLLEPYQLPEILRVRLEELCLQIKILKLGKVEPFVAQALDPPEEKAVSAALKLLKRLNALDEEENLTPLGYHLARLPLDPQIGKMILFGAMFSCLDPILTIASALSFKDPFMIPLGMEKAVDETRVAFSDGSKSDLIMLAKAYEGWEMAVEAGNGSYYCYENFLSSSSLRMIRDMRRQLAQTIFEVRFVKTANPKDESVNKNSENRQLIRAVICAGLYPNVAKLPPKVRMYGSGPKLISCEGPCYFHLKCVNGKEKFFESPWMVFHQRVKSSKLFLHDATMVYPLPLLLFGGKLTYVNDADNDTIVVDDWIKFNCPKDATKTVTDLRSELDRMLNYRIIHPNAWSEDTTDSAAAILNVIVDLLTNEKSRTPNV